MSENMNMTQETGTTDASAGSKLQNIPDGDFVQCPCCGKPTLSRPVEPNQLLVDHWLSCMLTGVPFSHEYALYNGRLRVTVTQLTPDALGQLDQLTTYLDQLTSQGYSEEGGMVNIPQMRGIARIFISIPEIKVTSGDKTHTYTPQAYVLEAASALSEVRHLITGKTDVSRDALHSALSKHAASLTDCNLISSVPPKMLMAVVETHNRLNDILMELGFDKNFWNGIELV